MAKCLLKFEFGDSWRLNGLKNKKTFPTLLPKWVGKILFSILFKFPITSVIAQSHNNWAHFIMALSTDPQLTGSPRSAEMSASGLLILSHVSFGA